MFAPLVIAILLSYALYPVVSFLRRLLIPRAVGATIVVASLLGLTVLSGISLQEPTMRLLDDIPEALKKFNSAQQQNERSPPEQSVLHKMQQTAIEIDRVTGNNEANEEVVSEEALPRVVIQEKKFDIRGFILGGSVSGVVLISQYLTVLLLVLFFLSSGKLYKQKLVKISGDSLAQKRITVNILDDINRQLRRYFFVMLIGAIFVGFITTLAFWILKFEGAVLWGTIAGVLSIVPYIGPAVVFVSCGMVAFVQFETVQMGILIAGTSLLITSLQGNVLTPLMTSRASSLNAGGIFVGLLFWGWLWGPVGLIVATPIQMIVKSVCDHVDGLSAVGELLGN